MILSTNKLFACRQFFEVLIKKRLFLLYISKECNGKSGVEYEMFNKQWVINEIFIEKAKRSSTFLLELGSDIFSKFDV